MMLPVRRERRLSFAVSKIEFDPSKCLGGNEGQKAGCGPPSFYIRRSRPKGGNPLFLESSSRSLEETMVSEPAEL